MDIGFGSPALFLLLTGGFGVSTLSAIARRDGPWTLAMALALVVSAHLAGLPAWLLVWGCTIVAIAVTMSVAATLLRWVAGANAFRIGLIGTLSMALLLVAQQRHSLPSAAAPIGDRSLALGDRLHQQVETLVRG